MLHFSPRPNRAHEIAWQPWSHAAFETARTQDKPILLSISAVWCHWCHVMDETSYSAQDVIDCIREQYVAIRVDNDQRPDVNARYNQGGWPTTAFLAPDGSLIAGGTYLPPDQMANALSRVATFYREHREEIGRRSSEIRIAAKESESAQADAPAADIVTNVLRAVEDEYDPEYGGFGTAPKFPMVDVLELLLQTYRLTGEQRYYDMLARTMLGMSKSGMYDHVEGGFFRYSTTRDWSIPHFEKMTEDHAGLLRVLAGLVRTTHNEAFRTTLLSSLAYVNSTLRDRATGLFAGSQDADEAYYQSALDERRAMQAPYVDRTSYSNWSAAMAATFVDAGAVLDDETLIAQGEQTLDALHDRLLDEEGLLYHYVAPNAQPSVRGLLTDQSAYLRALLDVHELGGQPRFFARAVDVAERIAERFAAPSGGFFDTAGIEASLGNLNIPDRPLAENARVAESLSRLAVLTQDERYSALAEQTLRAFAASYGRLRMFAAPYARAVQRWLAQPACVIIVAEPGKAGDLLEATQHLPQALLAVRVIDPADNDSLQKYGFEGSLRPAAYVCRGRTCAAPARTVAQLRSAYETLLGAAPI